MPDTSEALRLIELTSARLRNDIGDMTVASSPEIVSDRPDQALLGAKSDARPGQAPAAPASRTKLLQAAWGPDEQALSAERLLSLATGLPAGVTLNPTGLAQDCVFPPRTGRIVLNLLLLAAECLTSGGAIMLAGTADDLFLRIAGPGTAWPTGMAACIVSEAAACAAMSNGPSVQMPLTALLAHTSGVRLSFLMAASSQAQPPILRLGGG